MNADLVAAYVADESARGTLSPRALSNRGFVLRAFARDVGDPLLVSDRGVDEWLAAQQLTAKVRSEYRAHIRALIRWAASEGMSPAAEVRRVPVRQARASSHYGPTRTQLAVPSAWRDPIERWVDWLTAAGRPSGSLYLREWQLRQAAADLDAYSPATITADELFAWLARKNWAPETRRSRRSALRSFFEWMQASGRRPDNPGALLPAVSRTRYVARPAPEQVIRISTAAADSRVRLMILLAARLGLRRAEIAALHTDKVEQASNGVTYLRVMGKGRRERLLPLVDAELLDLVRAMPSGFLFPSPVGDHLTPAHVGKLVSRALGEKWTSHTLRHRFATVAYGAQRDLYAVQELLGHSTVETTRLYVQLPGRALLDAMRAASG